MGVFTNGSAELKAGWPRIAIRKGCSAASGVRWPLSGVALRGCSVWTRAAPGPFLGFLACDSLKNPGCRVDNHWRGALPIGNGFLIARVCCTDTCSWKRRVVGVGSMGGVTHQRHTIAKRSEHTIAAPFCDLELIRRSPHHHHAKTFLVSDFIYFSVATWRGGKHSVWN